MDAVIELCGPESTGLVQDLPTHVLHEHPPATRDADDESQRRPAFLGAAGVAARNQ